MKVTYVKHSCFLVELNSCYLLFDYFEGNLPLLKKEKPVYVLASHVHQDHFDFSVFERLKDHPQVSYLLSKDIRKKYNARFFERRGVSNEVFDRILFLSPDQTYEVDSYIHLRTLKSTDQGVAFLISCEGQRIYHAGDLNWWSWPGETKADEKRRETEYKTEIGKIQETVDAAFVVLDSRQEEQFYLGFDWFARHVRAEQLFPMHMWEDKTVVDRIIQMECSFEYRDRIVKMSEGEVL